MLQSNVGSSMGVVISPQEFAPLSKNPVQMFYEHRDEFVGFTPGQVIGDLLQKTDQMRLRDACILCKSVGELIVGKTYPGSINQQESLFNQPEGTQ